MHSKQDRRKNSDSGQDVNSLPANLASPPALDSNPSTDLQTQTPPVLTPAPGTAADQALVQTMQQAETTGELNRWSPRLAMKLDMELPITQCPTNLDLSSATGRALAFAAGNPADYRLDDKGMCKIVAHKWLAYPDEAEDPETGEVRQFARIVLFDRDGRFFKTTSAWGLRRLKAAIELYDEMEWRLGVPFVISARLSKLNRVYHDIRIAIDPSSVAG